MGPRIDGELLKIVKVDNGFVVYVWDPEPPPAVSALPGQSPCAQQPVKWWRTYVFLTVAEVNTFVSTFLESHG